MASGTSLTKPPTSLQGYVDPSTWAYALNEITEHVSTLHWPMSVRTYSEMRRDPQLTAILAAYTLPIRRATWVVDPAGCRDEVAQIVADDLGLPVKGHDTPGAARTRGVSWNEHLRMALQCLTFGHAAFEMLAKVTNKQARLVGLYERIQSTISWIYVDEQGQLGGISQTGGIGPGNKPEITADRLVWYANEREGGGWQGTSLLRPSFAAFTLKREMMRVLATSNSRFGMGVPTVEWSPGFIPSPDQMQAAQQAASAARVGNTAGLAMPPNAHLVLTGLSGGTPDTLAFLRWLDQQMAGSVLAQWMTLGESSRGSRALGEAFLDAFLLSLQSTADFVADQATRQIAARIVAWNWGEDEPVPAVRVSDVGVRHEVTAQALNMLLSSGALQADPALEAYVRSTFRLPERDPSVPWARPPVKGQSTAPVAADLTGGESGNAGVAASAPPRSAARQRRSREPSDGQLELPIAAAANDAQLRDLTADEIAAGVDFDGLHNDWQAARDDLWAQWPGLAAPIVDDLAQQVERNVDMGDLAALGALTVTPAVVTAISAALLAGMAGLSTAGAASVVAEAAHQGVTLAAGVADATRMQQTADATAALIASGYATAASRVALLNAGTDIDGATVAGAVRSQLDAMAEAEQRGWVVTNLASALQMAQSAGRMATFELSPDGTAFYAAERLDGGECLPCHEIDGHKFQDLADAAAAYPAGKYRECLGLDRCRGHVFALFGKD